MSKLILIGIALVALAAPAADAQPRSGHRGPEREGLQEMPSHPQGLAPPARRADEEHMRREGAPGAARLTHEELRQLRQDINSAGRDIYRRNPGQKRSRF